MTLRTTLNIYLAALLLISISLGVATISRPVTFAVAVLTSLMMGCVSPLIAARRLYFLAAESPHMALFAAALGIILANTTFVRYELFWVIVVGLSIIYVVGFAIHKGFDPDVVTSIAIGATVSGSVMAMYFALTRYRTSYSLWSLILGDPLLATQRDVYALATMAIVVVVLTLAIYKVVIYLGIDRDSAYLVFRNVHIYDFLFFTVVGLTSIAVIKIVGFVLEHVLLLLPALTAMNVVEGGRNVLVTSIVVAISSTLIGFSTAMVLNIAPASAVGFTILSMYIVTKALQRLGRNE